MITITCVIGLPLTGAARIGPLGVGEAVGIGAVVDPPPEHADKAKQKASVVHAIALRIIIV